MKLNSILGFVEQKYSKKSFLTVTTLFILFAFAISTGFALNKGDVVVPENPMYEVIEPQNQISLADKHGLPGFMINEHVDGEQVEAKDDSLDQNIEEEKDKTEEDEVENKHDANKTSVGKDAENSYSDIELVEGSHGETQIGTNIYFTTTIISNEVVTKPEYSFRIIQNRHNYNVNNVDVFVNDELISDFKGNVLLEEGANTIQVKVTYQNKNGEFFTVSRQYNVFLDVGEIIIYTDLKDKQIYKPNLSFTASAKKGHMDVPVTVLLNGKKINVESGKYEVKLEKGENIIQIVAEGSKGDKAQKDINIYYLDKQSLFAINTNLEEQQVKKPQISFQANATFKDQPTKLIVSCNDEIIQGDNGDYTVNLLEGENVIVLRAENSSNYIEEKYIVTYLPPVADDGEGEKDEKAPILVTDLVDGSKIKGSIRTFNVWPVDYQGNRIRGNGVTVLCNGIGVPFTWDDSTKTSYELRLKNGKNEITITVRDKEGRTTTERFYIYCDAVEDGQKIGTATVSLEATTIGLGYLIPPTKVNIYQGEPASLVIDRLFREHGLGYAFTGKLDSGFYLAHVERKNLVLNPVIPEDLAELVRLNATSFDPDDYVNDSLGEFDFSNGSGWMYSVNGTYPNYGFADCYMVDGDVMRIRFTLFYGMDIGGGGALGGGEVGWGKEW